LTGGCRFAERSDSVPADFQHSGCRSLNVLDSAPALAVAAHDGPLQIEDFENLAVGFVVPYPSQAHIETSLTRQSLLMLMDFAEKVVITSQGIVDRDGQADPTSAGRGQAGR
jgi:hypothetical protein